MAVLPEVGMKGRISVRSPFDSLIDPYAFYTCITLNTLQSMVSNGETPFETFYNPLGLTQEDMNDDLSAGAVIITFQCIDGDIVSVPSTYVNGIPDANGVLYQTTMLGVALSVLPDNQDLTDIKNSILGLIESRLGVKSKIEEVVYGAKTLIDVNTHERLQSLRKSRIVTATNDAALVKDLQDQIASMKTQLSMLEDYIAKTLKK